MLGQGQEEGGVVVGTVGDVPADLQGPGDDRLAQVPRRRTESRRGNGELRLPLLARLEAGRDDRFEE